MAVPDMHQVLELHCAHVPPLAPSYPGAHTQSVWSALPFGLREWAEHAWQARIDACPVRIWNVSDGHSKHASEDTCPVSGWYFPPRHSVQSPALPMPDPV